jgi:uncharacterized protein (DUF1684 family)
VTGRDAAADRLALADWRRQIADLYTEVRHLAAADPRAAWEYWREARDRLYREHPQSPLPEPARAGHHGRYWPYDESLRFEAGVDAATGDPAPAGPVPDSSFAAILPMSSGDALSFRRIGALEIPFPAGRRSLGLFWMAGYAGGLFLPFRDATNGAATYGAGRYLLDTAKGADLGGELSTGRLVVDFNFAFQPSCAFDPRWSCPLAPPGNRLDLAVEAGERLA